MFATTARFCVTRRRWVLAAWVLLLIIGLAAALPLFKHLKAANGAPGSQSSRGAAIVGQATGMGPTAVVLVRLASAFDLTLAGLMLRAEGPGDQDLGQPFEHGDQRGSFIGFAVG